jgi:hypothetical protein
MWKKICIALTAGAALSPGIALAFDPFATLSVGISQGMEVGTDVILNSTNDSESVQGGNVIIGTDPLLAGGPSDSFQGAVVNDDFDLNMTDGTDNVQGLNILHGAVAVLAIQGAAVTDNVTIDSSGGSGSVQGVNVIKTGQ